MRRLFVLGSVLLAGILATVWFVARDDEGSRALAARQGVAAPDAERMFPELAAFEAPLGEGAGEERTGAPRRAPLADASEEPVAPPAFELEVFLVARADGLPVGDAEVWYRALSPEDEAELDLERVDELQNGAPRARSDETGRVVLELEQAAPVRVVASRDRLWGVARIEPEGEGHTLELVPDWDLSVRVEGADGRPQEDVTVALTRSVGEYRRAFRQVTSKMGEAGFAHLGWRMAREPRAQWQVTAEVALLERPQVELDPRRPEHGPVLLILPPVGELEVLVSEEDGRPAPDGTEVVVEVLAPGEPHDRSPFSWRERPAADASTTAGRALIPIVDLDRELEIEVVRPGSEIATSVFARGPTTPGQRVTVEITLGLDHPVVAWRAVDEEGRVMADTELKLEVEVDQGFIRDSSDQEVVTDAKGSFRLDLDPRWREGDVRRLVVLAEEATYRAAEVDLGRRFPPGVTELGDLVLAPPPIVASGRVIDGDGAGCEGVRVAVQVPRQNGDEPSHVYWESEPALETTTDAAGYFENRGLTGADELRLEAIRDALKSEVVQTRVGTEGLVLTLVDAGTIAGSVLVDSGIPFRELRAGWKRTDLLGEVEEGSRLRLRDDGTFSFGDLLPGSYGVDLGVSYQDAVWGVEGVEVRAGETTRDPRLQEIDLRGVVHGHRIVLRLPRPDPELRGNIYYWPTGADPEEEGAWNYFSGTEVMLLSTEPELDLDLFVPGYRGVRLRGIRGDEEVELVDGLPIRLLLELDGPLPEPPVYLKAVLVDVEDERLGRDWGAPAFDETRETRIRAAAPGTLRVEWICERRSGQSALATTIDLSDEQLVTVGDVLQEQVFEVRLDAEELAAFLADF